MHIDQFTDAIKNCRFCFMCRHLSGIGNVTFTEADTPRVRASMIYGITLHPEQINDPDFIETIYRSDLSGACRRNCVSHYDENGLNLAMRADLVEAGLVPANIKAIADDMKKSSKWTVKGSGDVVYFVDRYSAEAEGVQAAFDKVMKAKKIAYCTVSGGSMGKALKILGFLKDAKALAGKFAKFVNGLKAKTIVVSNPAAYDALVNDFREYGIKLNARVMHTSEFFMAKKIAFTKKTGTVYYLESDFLRNYNNDYAFPYELLKAVKASCKPFGTNQEESYTCGEGAVILPKIDPSLVEKLAKYIEARADHPAKDVIVTASPYTKIQLSKYTSLKVKTLEEVAAAAL